MTAAKEPELIDETFTASITTEPNSGWACAVMPDSVDADQKFVAVARCITQ